MTGMERRDSTSSHWSSRGVSCCTNCKEWRLSVRSSSLTMPLTTPDICGAKPNHIIGWRVGAGGRIMQSIVKAHPKVAAFIILAGKVVFSDVGKRVQMADTATHRQHVGQHVTNLALNDIFGGRFLSCKNRQIGHAVTNVHRIHY